MGIEAIEICQNCIFTQVFATLKNEYLHTWDRILSRFVTQCGRAKGCGMLDIVRDRNCHTLGLLGHAGN